MLLFVTNCYILVFIYLIILNQTFLPQQREMMKVCRNAQCTFFLVHHYINRFIFFKLR